MANENEQETEFVDLSPSKETYESVGADVNRITAVEELIDNALDNWERESGREAEANITIRYDEDDEELVIRDDTGGVRADEIHMLFALGRSAKEDVPGSIGAYGIGGKKAIVYLGKEATIKSRHNDGEFGVGFTVGEDWLREEGNWRVEKEKFEDLGSGVTEIRIGKLNFDWDEEFASDLRNALGSTYDFFLGNELHKENNLLSIEVDGERVKASGVPDWTYSPFDGLHPRRYENIELDVPTIDEPVYLHVTAGLLRKKDTNAAGVDFYCQKRKILESVRDSRALFGDSNNAIGNFTVHHERLKVLVEFETQGDGRKLPWDAQKNDIDPYNPVMQEATDWMKRVIRPYYKIDVNKAPRSFVEFYPRDSEYATNNGAVERLDYHGRTYNTDQPDGDVPQIIEVQNTVEAHKKLGFRCSRALEDWQVPAYEAQFETELDKFESLDDYPELNTAPIGLDIDSVDGEIEEIEALAAEHIAKGVEYTGDLKNWQVPTYQQYVEDHAKDDLETITDADDLPDGVPASTDDLKTAEPAEPVDEEAGEVDKTNPDQAVSPSSTETSSASASDAENSKQDTIGGDSTDEETVEGVDQADTTEEVVGIAIRLQEGHEATEVLRSDPVELRQRLNLSKDASLEEVREELAERLGVLFPQPSA